MWQKGNCIHSEASCHFQITTTIYLSLPDATISFSLLPQAQRIAGEDKDPHAAGCWKGDWFPEGKLALNSIVKKCLRYTTDILFQNSKFYQVNTEDNIQYTAHMSTFNPKNTFPQAYKTNIYWTYLLVSLGNSIEIKKA